MGSRGPASGFKALFLVLMALLTWPVQAAKLRPYSLSVEVGYGHQTARQVYLEEIERHVVAWVAVDRQSQRSHRCPQHADLHLRVTIDEIERSRGYAKVSAERDVFADTGTSATSPYLHRTRLEVRAAIVDLQREGLVLFEDAFTIYNEVQETKVSPNPRQRSWEDNLRVSWSSACSRFLSRRGRKIRAYIADHPRGGPMSRSMHFVFHGWSRGRNRGSSKGPGAGSVDLPLNL